MDPQGPTNHAELENKQLQRTYRAPPRPKGALFMQRLGLPSDHLLYTHYKFRAALPSEACVLL